MAGRLVNPPVHNATTVALTAADGWELKARVFEPSDREILGTVICGHAMMVTRATLCRTDRPTVALTLVEAGFRVIAPDLRGHGESGPTPQLGGDWGYDELVADTGVFLSFVRRTYPKEPVALLGHSLFGHTSLAYLSTHPTEAPDALVLMGTLVWGGEWEVSRFRLWKKRWLVRLSKLPVWLWGYAPVRLLGVGTADEAKSYCSDLTRMVLKGRWAGQSGVDYYATLGALKMPVLTVVSDNDKWLGQPDETVRWLSPLDKYLTVIRLSAPEPFLPDHMQLVTSPRAEPIWRRIGAWLVTQLEG